MSNRSFNERKNRLNEKRHSLGTITIDNKLERIDEATNRKVKFSNFEDSDSNDDRKEAQSTDSQYESQDSSYPQKPTSVRHRKISPAHRQNFGRKYSDNCIETISQSVSDNALRKISTGTLPPSLMNRRDSKVQVFADPESGVRTSLLITLNNPHFTVCCHKSLIINCFHRKRHSCFQLCLPKMTTANSASIAIQ